MPVPTVTIRIQAGRQLMERIQEVSRHLDVTPANFIEYAIESELSRQETDRQLEHVALDQLRQRVLDAGQGASIHLDEETGEHATCALCLRVIPRGRGVDGPMLCDACYTLAKGNR